MGKPFPLHLKPARGARHVAAMSKREPKPRLVRNMVLRVRCSEAEHANWMHKARAQERSLSDYARHVLSVEPMQRRARPPVVEPELLAAVGRAGNNLNQIARAMHTDRKAGRRIDLIAVYRLRHPTSRESIPHGTRP
jgi:hypothetical protein